MKKSLPTRSAGGQQDKLKKPATDLEAHCQG